MESKITRRHLLGAASTVAVASGLSVGSAHAAPRVNESQVRYCLNTSTIRGQELGLVKEIQLAAQAGYDGIEPWIREIQAYQDQGGSLDDLRKQLEDLGLRVESAIGFANWIVDDDEKRAAALEQAKRDMDLVRQIGGERIAAPPAGATRQTDMDLFAAAKRYGDLIRVGREIGVLPQLELWGFSTTLSRIGELALVASECGEPDAGVMPDVYHIYKGGSSFHGLKLLNARTIHVFHMNDYPAEPDRANISDQHRVYPGEGIAPLDQILSDLIAGGFSGALSLELFNRDYWQQDPAEVVARGLASMKGAVAAVA